MILVGYLGGQVNKTLPIYIKYWGKHYPCTAPLPLAQSSEARFQHFSWCQPGILQWNMLLFFLFLLSFVTWHCYLSPRLLFPWVMSQHLFLWACWRQWSLLGMADKAETKTELLPFKWHEKLQILLWWAPSVRTQTDKRKEQCGSSDRSSELLRTENIAGERPQTPRAVLNSAFEPWNTSVGMAKMPSLTGINTRETMKC